MRWLLMVPLLVACGRKDADNKATDTVDDGVAEDTWDGLWGDAPDSPIGPPPNFTVINYDGGSRTGLNMLGQPAVLWFVPNEESSC